METLQRSMSEIDEERRTGPEGFGGLGEFRKFSVRGGGLELRD